MTSVPRRWMGLAATTVLGVALLPSQALSARPPVPATLYPAHSHITTVPSLSNREMDCDWGFVCRDGQPLTQEPLFHLRPQDDLHRLAGWAVFARSRFRGHQMLFAVFASRYSPDIPESMPWNVRAFADFRGATLMQGYQDLEHVPRLAPRGVVANDSLQELRLHSAEERVLACWAGTIEVEGIAIYAHGSRLQRRVATRSLTRQLSAAVRAMLATTAGIP